MTNQTVVLAHSHKLLDEAGLLERVNGKIVSTTYDNRKQTPYGFLSESLIY